MGHKRNVLLTRIKKEYKEYLEYFERNGDQVDASDDQLQDFGCYLQLKFNPDMEGPYNDLRE